MEDQNSVNYYRKELVSNPLRLPSGHIVKFTEVADDTGVLATEEGYLISELNAAIARHVGGVVAIEASEYEELKKNPPSKPSLPPWLDGQNLPQRLGVQSLAANVVVEDGKLSAMAQSPKPAAAAPASREGAPLVVPQNIPVTAKVKRGPSKAAKSESALE